MSRLCAKCSVELIHGFITLPGDELICHYCWRKMGDPTKPLKMTPRVKRELAEIFGDDSTNIVHRYFRGKALETCPKHGVQDIVLVTDSGLIGKSIWSCMECYLERDIGHVFYRGGEIYDERE